MPTPTSPELKWLLVERATLAGDIARLEKTREHLAREISEYQVRVDALDLTMQRIERRINVNAAGTIQRHTIQYGKRGAMKEFLIAILKEASPGSVDTKTIVAAAIAHFKLEFASKADFKAFAHSGVSRQILALKKEGLVEPLHRTGGAPAVGIWRWKKDDLPTIGQLAALASS